jgi:hypothetical protein
MHRFAVNLKLLRFNEESNMLDSLFFAFIKKKLLLHFVVLMGRNLGPILWHLIEISLKFQ